MDEGGPQPKLPPLPKELGWDDAANVPVAYVGPDRCAYQKR